MRCISVATDMPSSLRIRGGEGSGRRTIAWQEVQMGRARQRIRLEDGLKLDLNQLARDGYVRPGADIGLRGVRWTHAYWGEIAFGIITADMRGCSPGWLRIRVGHLDQPVALSSLDQRVELSSQPRRYGGQQWYFVCPANGRLASVLWKPPGAERFCSRQAWGGQVAYSSQFKDATQRAHQGTAKVKARLIADQDPDAWDLPPKPKWMRWSTYNTYVARFDRYEQQLDDSCVRVVAKLLKL